MKFRNHNLKCNESLWSEMLFWLVGFYKLKKGHAMVGKVLGSSSDVSPTPNTTQPPTPPELYPSKLWGPTTERLRAARVKALPVRSHSKARLSPHPRPHVFLSEGPSLVTSSRRRLTLT